MRNKKGRDYKNRTWRNSCKNCFANFSNKKFDEILNPEIIYDEKDRN